jgi:hypothetical protein
VKIYVAAAAVETLRKYERQGETEVQYHPKLMGFFPYFFFAGCFLNLTLCMTKLKLKVLVVLSFS